MENLIFDRTATDVKNRTAKGYYNLSDLNRIIDYINYIKKYIKDDSPFSVSFALGEVITSSKMQLILDSVQELTEKWYVADDTPEVPTKEKWDYLKANDLEKILFSLNEFIISDQKNHFYLGTFRSGSAIRFARWQGNAFEYFYTSDSSSYLTSDGEEIMVVQ